MPSIPDVQPVDTLAGRRLVAAHGKADRMTSFAATEQFVRRAAATATSADFIDMGDLDHFMLRGLRRWNAVARERTVALFD